MNITLSPELKRFVEAKIGKSAGTPLPGDVVREAVRLMEAREPASARAWAAAIIDLPPSDPHRHR